MRIIRKGPMMRAPLAVLLAAVAMAVVGVGVADAHRYRGRCAYPVRYGAPLHYYSPVHCYPYYSPVHCYPYPVVHYYAPVPRFAFSIATSNVPPYGHYFYDPYCDLRFSSLDVYAGHLHRYRHPRLIRVIAVDTGYPVCTWRYRGGSWVAAY